MKKYFYLLLIGLTTFLGACKKNKDNAGLNITKVFPTSGAKGTPVLIIGSGFDEEAANNTVLFNGKEAEVTSATSTLLEVVSPIGAGTGAVEVITKNGQKATGTTFYHRWTANASTLQTNGAVFDNNIFDLAIDAAGNLYAVCGSFIYKVTPEGQVSKISNNILANNICGIAINSKDEIFVAAYLHNVLYRLANNALTVVAGKLDTPGDVDAQGATARFQGLYGLDIDKNDNMYVVDLNTNTLIHKIKKISPTYQVTTLSSNLTNSGNTADVSVNQTGDSVLTASGYQVVRIVANKEQVLAGTVDKGDKDGAALEAQFSGSWGIYKLRGEVFISDYENKKLRYLSADGQVFTLLADIDARSIVENKDGILFMAFDDKIIKIILE